MWECPTSAIPSKCWDMVELFWLCHARTPGFSGWVIQRTAFPHPGTPLEQDNLIMRSFEIIEACYYKYQVDTQAETEAASELEQWHRKVQGKK